MGIVSVVMSLLPLIPAIKGLIQGAENTQGGGGGEAKKNLVVEGMRPFFKLLQDSGKLPAEFSLPAVEQIIEMIFTEMKGSNELHEKPNPTSAGQPPLKPGISWPATFQGTINFAKVPK